MTASEFDTMLAVGYESRGIEFKGPGIRSERPFLAQVARAVMGLANRRDGGSVILGVQDDGGILSPIGLADDHLESWRAYDDVAESINEYASPSVAFDREIFSFRGSQYVILNVREFVSIPVLCRRGYNIPNGRQVLREGACYVRSAHKPETSEIPSEQEMRELLDLAIEKGVREYLERARRVGLLREESSQPPTLTDLERLEQQIGGDP